jgi:hypothetical protein
MEAHEALLERLSRQEHHRGKCFIKDGIIDPRRWKLASPKVLLLLKEARHEGTAKWDYRSYLRKWNDKNSTLRNAAYWCYAIHRLFRGDLPSLPSKSDEYVNAIEALRSSAIVNLKKSGGRRTSSIKDIAQHAERDKRFIQHQLKLIKPEVVVCGYTWRYIEEWRSFDRASAGVYRDGARIFVDFWHPSFRGSDEMKYYALAGQLISFLLAVRQWKVAATVSGWQQ